MPSGPMAVIRVTQSPDLAEWKWKRLHFIAIKLIAAVNVENAQMTEYIRSSWCSCGISVSPNGTLTPYRVRPRLGGTTNNDGKAD